MAEQLIHRPVLLEEALAALNIRPDGVYVDGTFGRGGHSGAILQRLGPDGRLYAMDKDPDAVHHARETMAGDPRFQIVQGSFAMLEQQAQIWGVAGQVDGVLLDLGVSSPQLDAAARGFSFRLQGPLDMRMDTTRGESAAEWLAKAPEKEIAQVVKTYGEERFAKRVARAIVEARRKAPIRTTVELAEIVAKAIPRWEKGQHPATRTFQGIRIHINKELEDLESCLPQAVEVLGPGGRLAVISFHSLEDRIVKRFMRLEARGEELPPDLPIPQAAFQPRLKLVGKPVRPGDEEVAANPRARSALLRVAEKVA